MLNLRFKFKGKCPSHPNYNPELHGRPNFRSDTQPTGIVCQGCDDLWVIHQYTDIARKKAENSQNIINNRAETAAEAFEDGEVTV